MSTWNLNVQYGSWRWDFAGNSGAAIILSPSLLVRFLLDADNDELRWLERCEPDNDDDLTGVDVGLGHRVAFPATNEIGIRGFLALERADPEQAVHETADIAA